MGPILNCSFFLSGYFDYRVYSLMLFAVIVTFSIFYLTRATRGVIKNTAFLFIITGGGANIIERFKTGCVEDNISFFGLFMFNIQDIFVVIGVLIMMFYIIKDGRI